jgi:serine/threonine-protein kinase
MMRLFEQGRTLVKEGRWEDAATKFEAAIAIEPSVGALLNLGDCLEHLKRHAKARRRFLEASALAGDSDATRAGEARARAQRLDGQVATLVFVRRYDASAGEPRLTVDGEATAPHTERFEVDPGTHEIAWTFPDLGAQTETVTARAGETKLVVVLAPSARKAEPQPPQPASPPSHGDRDQGLGTTRWAAIGVGAAGIVGLGVGTIFGVVALGKRSDLDGLCPAYPHCAESQRTDVQGKYDDAKHAATISTVGFVLGGVLLAGGVVLWLVAPGRAAASTAAWVTAHPSGVSVAW